MPFLTKQFKFCAAHQYWNDNCDLEKNTEVFGDDIKIHGHNYILEVSMTGPVNPDTGWLVDLGHVNKIVKSNVVDIIDHSQIEKDIPWFEGKQPSSEVIVVWIWEQIDKDLEGAKLHRISLVETHSIHTDYYGPNK